MTPTDAPTATALARPGYALSDSLWADQGSVYLTGTQALLRVLLMQRQRDAAAGLATQGFLSGYRGSPLGAVDQAVWKAGPSKSWMPGIPGSWCTPAFSVGTTTSPTPSRSIRRCS